MQNNQIVIVDCETGIVTQRDMTDEEQAQHELDAAVAPPILEAPKP